MASTRAELFRQCMETYGPDGIRKVITETNRMLSNWQLPIIVNLDGTTDWAFQMSLARLRIYGGNVTHQTSEYFSQYRPTQSVQHMLGDLGADSRRDELRFDGYSYREHDLYAILELLNLEVPPRGMTKSDFDLHLAAGKDRLITHIRNNSHGAAPSAIRIRQICLESLEKRVDQIEPPQYPTRVPSENTDRERPTDLGRLDQRIKLAKRNSHNTCKLEMWWQGLKDNAITRLIHTIVESGEY